MRSQAYHIFWQRIHKKAKKKRFPLRAMFEITYRCNFNCPHCYIPESFRKESEERELATREVFSILGQLKNMGCLWVGFTGGEPFVRKDFMDILWYAKAKGFEISIYTNAALIDETIAETLRKLKPNIVDITISSLNEEVFDRVVQTQGAYGNVFKAVKLLYKRNIPLGFKSCLLKENEDEIGKLREFAGVHNSFFRLDTMLMPRLNGSKEPYLYRGRLSALIDLGSDKQFYSAECSLFTLKQKTDLTKELFSCGAGLCNMAINPFGEVKMCVSMNYPRYRISESSLEECWRGLNKLIEKIKKEEHSKCVSCELQSYCKWCPARSWLENGKFSGCVSLTEDNSTGLIRD